jgi:hypothetical protein
MTSSARARIVSGTGRPSTGWRSPDVTTSSNFIGCWTGGSPALAPLRIRPTQATAYRKGAVTFAPPLITANTNLRYCVSSPEGNGVSPGRRAGRTGWGRRRRRRRPARRSALNRRPEDGIELGLAASLQNMELRPHRVRCSPTRVGPPSPSATLHRGAPPELDPSREQCASTQDHRRGFRP